MQEIPIFQPWRNANSMNKNKEIQKQRHQKNGIYKEEIMLFSYLNLNSEFKSLPLDLHCRMLTVYTLLQPFPGLFQMFCTHRSRAGGLSHICSHQFTINSRLLFGLFKINSVLVLFVWWFFGFVLFFCWDWSFFPQKNKPVPSSESSLA